jgi:hypothetical protein
VIVVWECDGFALPSPGPRRKTSRPAHRPGTPALRRRGTGPAAGHRHHRAPTAEGKVYFATVLAQRVGPAPFTAVTDPRQPGGAHQPGQPVCGRSARPVPARRAPAAPRRCHGRSRGPVGLSRPAPRRPPPAPTVAGRATGSSPSGTPQHRAGHRVGDAVGGELRPVRERQEIQVLLRGDTAQCMS